MRLTFLLILVLSTITCGQERNGIFEIDPKVFVENKITLSEIADDIIYVPLDNSLPIGITYKLKITHDYIYISTKDIGIVKFDRSGKLVRKIGNRGSGPGEYHYGMDFATDDKTGNIFVMDPGKIKVYSPSGIFLRDLLVKEYLNYMGDDIEIYNSFLFIPDYLRLGDSKNIWIFLDTLGNLVSKKENSVPPFNADIGGGNIYQYANTLFYYNWINDTIFSISPDLSSKEAYLFAQGDHRWPTTRVDISSWSSLSKLFKPGTMFETKKFILLLYSYLDKYAICLIDKKTKKTFLAYKYYKEAPEGTVKYRPYLTNDLDGGMPLTESIHYYVEKDKEYITQLINTLDLKQYISSDEFKNNSAKYLEKKKEIETLANRLKETDNPVLMIVKLKE